MSLPKRKHPRLKQHDYSEPGAYFITVCTKNKAHILSRIVVDLPSIRTAGCPHPAAGSTAACRENCGRFNSPHGNGLRQCHRGCVCYHAEPFAHSFSYPCTRERRRDGGIPPYDSPNGSCHQNGDYTPPWPFHLSNILLRSCHTRAAGL